MNNRCFCEMCMFLVYIMVFVIGTIPGTHAVSGVLCLANLLILGCPYCADRYIVIPVLKEIRLVFITTCVRYISMRLLEVSLSRIFKSSLVMDCSVISQINLCYGFFLSSAFLTNLHHILGCQWT